MTYHLPSLHTIEDVRFELRLKLPGPACSHYTTSSIFGVNVSTIRYVNPCWLFSVSQSNNGAYGFHAPYRFHTRAVHRGIEPLSADRQSAVLTVERIDHLSRSNRTWTYDFDFVRVALSQLSYAPIGTALRSPAAHTALLRGCWRILNLAFGHQNSNLLFRTLAGDTGFEPVTLKLTASCSDQLS